MTKDKETRNAEFKPEFLPDMLPVYYKRLFPHIPFYSWLSYGLSENGIFTNREISFTLVDDIYIRFQSYENQSELEKDICSRSPYKIDIGAVMSIRPRDRFQISSAKPLQRELVFDIDMTDYDDVRNCCSEDRVCVKCWKYMAIACRILDAALREDFGFEHILWVFSGRRGIHGWVCDKTARHLDGRGRSAVAEYLQIVQPGGENRATKVAIGDRMHHSVKRALKVIESMFEEVCLLDQNLFATPKGLSKLLSFVQDETVRTDLEAQLKKHEGDSTAIWETFTRFFAPGNNPVPKRHKNIVEEVQFGILYPRLDINVTKGLNHLLKAPFCVHPKTGKICLPFNPNAASKFDPTTVPTINSLLEEINAFDVQNKDEIIPENRNRIKDYKKTGMFKGVVVFEEFLRKIRSSYEHLAIETSDSTLEF